MGASTSRSAGPLMMALSSLLFALMGLLVKVATREVPSGEVVFWRSFVSFVALVPFALADARVWRASTWWPLVLRGVTGTGSMACYFLAISRLPLGDAVMISYASPIVVALLSPWILGERPVPGLWGALALGFAGVSLVAGPRFEGDALGVGAALATAVFAGLAYIYVRESARTERSDTIVFWFCGIGSVITAPTLWPSPTIPSVSGQLALLGVGLLGLLAQLAMTRAYALGDAATISLYSYLTPVFAAGLGAWTLGEPVGWRTLAGTALVAAAGAWASSRPPARPDPGPSGEAEGGNQG
jgi:drug/metabolite transporter (DMT)-like permease